MQAKVYPCGWNIPQSGILDNFKDLSTAKCTFCRDTCEPPIVDATVRFLDGYNKVEMTMFLMLLFAFSMLYELIKKLKLKPKYKQELQKLKEEEKEEEAKKLELLEEEKS